MTTLWLSSILGFHITFMSVKEDSMKEKVLKTPRPKKSLLSKGIQPVNAWTTQRFLRGRPRNKEIMRNNQ